ncbi:MAG: SPOR domain-containing protein [Bacteroidota bacterium]
MQILQSCSAAGKKIDHTNVKEPAMKNAVLLYALTAILGIFWGCGSSEETNADDLYIPPGARREHFVTKRDTIVAKIVPPAKVDTARNISSPSAQAEQKDTTSSAVFTIQVGAFGNEINARRWEEQTKEILKMPTYIEYDLHINIYRVTIGTFISREQAAEIARDIRQRYPTMYRDAWVIESLRTN